MSRLVQQRNGHWREVWDVIPSDCAGCGKPLRAPNISLGVAHCPDHGQQRDLTCLTCGTTHVDHDCPAMGPQDLGTPYFRAPAGQHGPTADFGEG